MTEKLDDEFLPKKSLFTTFEVAEYFQVTDRTIRLWMEHGILKGEKIQGTLRISRESILMCRFKRVEKK